MSLQSKEQIEGAPDGRAVVNGAASVSAVPASIPSAAAVWRDRLMPTWRLRLLLAWRMLTSPQTACATICLIGHEKAQAMETRRAETTGSVRKHDSAVRKDAP